MQSSSVLHSQSFHPVFKTSISAPGHENCSLHLHYELPPLIFVDPYELSNRADAYSFKHAGPSNLELPVFALGPGDDGNATLLVSAAQPLSVDGVLDVEVPLHVRYARATESPSSFQLTRLSWPEAFLECPRTYSTSSQLPPMRREFAAAFDGAAIVRLAPPPGAIPVETIRTPVGDAADVGRVELGTAVVVIAAFFYLMRVARRTVARLSSPSISEPVKKE
ncbi:RBR-type E3 ubiquitin transferase [Mycena venus]|uniref:Protein PBN1 n=1 Tax=Mycena venus TaxID=2733690 RepID=A0A8H6YL25_9AGAR|nr:RBR-type E3 ubiquitin transferase [Mycena venus]